jgi:hypothetical protein
MFVFKKVNPKRLVTRWKFYPTQLLHGLKANEVGRLRDSGV